MRVLLVLTPPLDPTTGGVQMSTVKMARMLSGQGYEVAVYSFEKTGHVEHPQASLYPAPESGNVDNPANHAGLTECLRAYAPDVVINQMPYEHVITDTIAANSDAIHIACLRNTLYSVRNNLDGYGARLLPNRLAPLARNPLGRGALLAFHRRRHAQDLRRILSSYDKFVMFAEPNLDELAYFVPDYDRDKIALIPNSIEGVAGQMPDKAKRILWLGRVAEHQKRADLILPLWRQMAEVLPDWTLDVVGDGPLLPTIQTQAAAEGLPRIVFHGRQPSQPFFEQAAIYLMTSDFEGFPNTLVEAQSQGAAPVVFDTYPMARWLVRSGENGVLVPAGDVRAMADQVVGLAKDAEGRHTMAKAAINSAAGLSEDRVAVAWRSLLDGMVNPNGFVTQA
ncbi:UNVERIFIED_CONTAM: glycosyltransferase [Spiribacter pallidus]